MKEGRREVKGEQSKDRMQRGMGNQQAMRRGVLAAGPVITYINSRHDGGNGIGNGI